MESLRRYLKAIFPGNKVVISENKTLRYIKILFSRKQANDKIIYMFKTVNWSSIKKC